jgi:OOP family OmpA-OmpF porin
MTKLKKRIAALSVSSAMMLAVSHASAQAYVGGSVGQSDIDEEITTGLITSGSVDGKDSAFKIFGGYMFNRNFGIEGAYVDLGEVSYSGFFGASTVTGGSVEVTGFNISALGAYPINEQFSVFGKIGMFLWKAEASDTTAGAPFSAKDDGADVSFGVGLGYNFTRNLGVRAEWEMFKTDDADATLLSVGLLWRF